MRCFVRGKIPVQNKNAVENLMGNRFPIKKKDADLLQKVTGKPFPIKNRADLLQNVIKNIHDQNICV